MKNKILNVEITSEEQRNELVKQLQEMEFEKELPKSWEELKTIEGCYVKSDSSLKNTCNNPVVSIHKNVFKTEKQAKKALAMAQLSQLMAVYNDGWEPDWQGSSTKKYIIYRDWDEIEKESIYNEYHFLRFKDELTRDAFFTNFQPLIRQFFELDGN